MRQTNATNAKGMMFLGLACLVNANNERLCGDQFCLPANFTKAQRPKDNMDVYLQIHEVNRP